MYSLGMYSSSFESQDIGAIDFFFVESVASLLRYIMLGQSYPIYIVVVVDPFCYMTFSMIAQLTRAGLCDSHFLIPYASSLT